MNTRLLTFVFLFWVSLKAFLVSKMKTYIKTHFANLLSYKYENRLIDIPYCLISSEIM